jgi:hypothetical protein
MYYVAKTPGDKKNNMMKTIYIKSVAINALLCVALALPAAAQHREAGGGGGGGAQPAQSGGGGARPSVSGGGAQNNAARPSFNGGGAARSSFNGGNTPRTFNSVSPQHNNAGYARPSIGPRQGVAPGQRGVSASAKIGLSSTARPAYRTYPGLPGGSPRIGGSGRPHGGYYNAHGYYNSFYAPHLGFRLNVLPFGYYPFYWGSNQYFYGDGLYYQYTNDQYVVVEPPVGAAINTLPDNAQPIMINGVQYYELNGVYYQPITKDDGSVVYQVAGKDGELNTDGSSGAPTDVAPPQIGDMVTTLPEGCRTIKINGQKYYVSPDDYYYQDAQDNNNNKVYKIVGTPSDEPNQ